MKVSFAIYPWMDGWMNEWIISIHPINNDLMACTYISCFPIGVGVLLFILVLPHNPQGKKKPINPVHTLIQYQWFGSARQPVHTGNLWI